MADSDRKLTDAELAILSLLAEQPMHGYQIEQVIEARGMREWVEMGFSSIYYLLGKLKKSGLLESRMVKAEGKGPARQVFNLTKKGKEQWHFSVINAISDPHRGFSNFQLGLSNTGLIEPAEVVNALRNYLYKLNGRRDGVEEKYKSYGLEIPLSADLLFQYSLESMNSEIKSVEKIIDQLGEKNESNRGL